MDYATILEFAEKYSVKPLVRGRIVEAQMPGGDLMFLRRGRPNPEFLANFGPNDGPYYSVTTERHLLCTLEARLVVPETHPPLRLMSYSPTLWNARVAIFFGVGRNGVRLYWNEKDFPELVFAAFRVLAGLEPLAIWLDYCQEMSDERTRHHLDRIREVSRV